MPTQLLCSLGFGHDGIEHHSCQRFTTINLAVPRFDLPVLGNEAKIFCAFDQVAVMKATKHCDLAVSEFQNIMGLQTTPG